MNRLLLSMLLLFIISNDIRSQNSIKVGSTVFDQCEVLDAQISQESLMISISEYNMTDFDFEKLPELSKKALILSIGVGNIDDFSFPISAADNFSVRLSGIQSRMAESKFQIEQVKSQTTNASRLKEEADGLNREKQSIEEQSREISQQLMDGKITPDEAARRIEALSSGMMSKVETSEELNYESESFEEKSNYSIEFYDLKSLESTRLIDGVLNIKLFNEEEFIAEFNGQAVTECLERRSTSSIEEKNKCSSVESALLPDTKVLREGPIQGTVNIRINKFGDNR